MFGRMRANRFNARGLALHEQGRIDAAIESYEKAAAAAPSWSTPLYNLGLMYKLKHDWSKSCEYNRRATELDPQNAAGWWNLGIAATALGRWDLARLAWKGFGIKLPDGDGPIDLPGGPTPLRLNPQGEGEVVWGDRIDPARAILSNIPFPESGFGWRDLVLNDGAPTGKRVVEGRDYPVFDVLELLERSPFGTYVARVDWPGPVAEEGIQTLMQTVLSLDGFAEDWFSNVRILCKACSEGRVHEEHDTAAAPAKDARLIGVAARSREHAMAIVAAWEAKISGFALQSLQEGLKPGVGSPSP